MTGDKLSQEEIEMLFAQNAEQTDADAPIDMEDLNEVEKDALGEIGNISFGNAATALSSLLNQKVEINTPTVSVISWRQIEEGTDTGMAVQVTYTTGFSGVNVLFLKQRDVAVIADILLGGDGSAPSEELDEIQLSAVQETMNQMIGSAATSMSAFFDKRVDISTPQFHSSNETLGEVLHELADQTPFAQVSFDLRVGEIIDSKLIMLIPIQFAKDLVEELLLEQASGSGQEAAEETAAALQMPVMEQEIEEEFEHAPQRQAARPAPKKAQAAVQRANFSSFDEEAEVQPDTQNLDVLLDIPLQVTVELGRTKRTVNDILEMGSGSIIELDKLAGEPVDILINNRLIATGEVVVIDENFGVRVTNILSRKGRLQHLK